MWKEYQIEFNRERFFISTLILDILIKNYQLRSVGEYNNNGKSIYSIFISVLVL